MKAGIPPLHIKPVEGSKPQKKTKVKEKPVAKAPQTEESFDNVRALKTDPEEDLLLLLPPEFSEDALAERFTEKFHEKLSFCGPWKKWMVWDGNCWKVDDSFIAVDHARQIVREVNSELLDRTDLGEKRYRMANAIATHRTMSSIERIAKTDRRHVIVPADFDSDPWLLNTPDGVIDLRTGSMRPPRRDDFLTKSTAVGPGGKCPLWLQYLDEATQSDEELKGYLKRIAGYCLTGSIAEHAFFFCYGTGGNGKGIYKDMLDWMLNSYATTANIDTFTEQRFSRHSSEIAYFQGARLVTSTEPSEGSKWAESRIKAMTGGDPITAAHKHENEFTFLPLFKLLFTGNHKPALKAVDDAIRRRLYLIPFEHKVTAETKDIYLPEKLRQEDEARGILEWMLEGCLEWQETMLNPPKRVLASTADYLESEDRIGQFLAETTKTGPNERVVASLLYAKYKYWTDVENEFCLSKKRFHALLGQKGFHVEKRSGDQVIMGLSIMT